MTNHWDEFSKSLAEPLPRRESLRRLGIALAGTVLSPLGLQSAFAGHHPKPQTEFCKTFCKCRNKKQQDQCLKVCNACGTDPGRIGGSCGSYFCCDVAGQSSCGSYCAVLASDPYNCGACGSVCRQPGQYEYGGCIDGSCEYACFEGAVRCDGICTYLDWDPYNCGACGYACDPPGPNESAWCINGRCEYRCYEGAVYCDGTCTFLSWDPANCGGCGNVCPDSTPYCDQGVCIRGDEPCPGGGTRCSGKCTNISFDPSNCGACGNVCPGGYQCAGGICQLPF